MIVFNAYLSVRDLDNIKYDAVCTWAFNEDFLHSKLSLLVICAYVFNVITMNAYGIWMNVY